MKSDEIIIKCELLQLTIRFYLLRNWCLFFSQSSVSFDVFDVIDHSFSLLEITKVFK